MKTVVIALGGNAILKKGEKPDSGIQFRNTKKALEKIFPLIKNNNVVITHGNGPQVGYLLIQQNAPLDVLDAETEGQIGYLIQQNLHNLITKNKLKRSVATVLTQVLVSKKDTSFAKPEKFVGPFYTKKEAEKLKKKFLIKEDVGRGYRRVVPSPKPIEIIESSVIKKMLEDKIIVIAAGGGGIPVVKTKGNKLEGVEAVIDKDLASQCLANSIKAEELIIITDIDGVYINFNKKNQKKLEKVKLKELEKYYKAGEFPRGSMGPKVEATINFLKKGGKKVMIGNVDKRGTEITK